MSTQMKGVSDMAYETKVILIAIANIVRNADNLKDVYGAIEKMANAEGIVIEPFEEEDSQN